MNVQIAIPPTGQIKRMISKIEATKTKRELKDDLHLYAREFVKRIQIKNLKDHRGIRMNDEAKMEHLYMMTIGMKRETLMLVSRYLGIHRGVTTRRHDLEMMITKKIRLWIEDLRNGWFD